MLRVFFTGAYRKPRQATWIFGLFLIILVVLSNFTGYLLPWDQLSYWAVTISTSLLQYIPLVGSALNKALIGGSDVGSTTLSNFFNLHTGIIPLILVLLMAHHFWRIRKAGGLIVPETSKEPEMVNTQPNLTSREFVMALVIIALLLAISAFFDAPLRERANPAFSPNPAKAPWYFMGLQELLIHFHPFFAVFIIPLTILTGSLCLPYIRLNDTNYGIWFLSQKGIKSGIFSACSAAVFSVIFILVSELLPDPETILPGIPSIITTGLVPFIIVSGSIYIFLKSLISKLKINRSEYIQSLLIILVVSYTVLSLVGILFRGEGMDLMWPWQI
jgi:quinol-cytochrome oxidoreductase complex cytochrome b subunit